jgi:hypothetical protein
MVEDLEEGRGGFVQDTFEATDGKNAAGSIVLVHTVNNALIGLGPADNVSNAYLFGRHPEGEPSAHSPAGREKTILTKGLNNFDQMIS